MKAVKITLIVLFLSIAAFAQTNDSNFLQFKARIGFDDEKERIAAQRYSDDGTKMTLIGLKSVQIWDIPTAKLVESHPHEIVEPDKFFGTTYEFSPDGSRVIVLDSVSRTLKKSLVVATAYDVQTGKRVAVLQRPETPVRYAFWSLNGETVVTFSGLYNEKRTEISFWNGADFAFRQSIFVDGYTWHYLSKDGTRLFVGNGGQIKLLGISAGASEGSVIRAYDTRTGEVEKEFTAGGAEFSVENLYTHINFDERFLATKKDKNIIVWEIAGKSQPKYELAPRNPKGRFSFQGFSRDGRYLIAEQSNTNEFYDAATGELAADVSKYFELERDDVKFSPDGKYALLAPCEKATVLEAATNRPLYTVKSKCVANYAKSPTQEDPYPTIYNYFSYDNFKISPRGKYLLNFHYKKLEVRDFLTGALLQTVLRKTDKNFQMVNKLITKWEIVGGYALVNGEDNKSILIWEINEN